MTDGKLTHNGKTGKLTVATKKRGILEVEALQVGGHDVHPVWQGVEMFNAEILPFEKRITDLGLGHLLDYEKMLAMEIHEPTNQIVSALDAKEAEIDSFNELNNEAWFLANFLRYRFQIGDAKVACTIEHVGCSFDLIVLYAIGLGRLIEWWRWRSEDIEASASKTYKMHTHNIKNSLSGNDAKREMSRLRKIHVVKIAVKLKCKDLINPWPAKKLVHEVQAEINALAVPDALKKHLRKNEDHLWEDSTIRKDLSDSGFFKR